LGEAILEKAVQPAIQYYWWIAARPVRHGWFSSPWWFHQMSKSCPVFTVYYSLHTYLFKLS